MALRPRPCRGRAPRRALLRRDSARGMGAASRGRRSTIQEPCTHHLPPPIQCLASLFVCATRELTAHRSRAQEGRGTPDAHRVAGCGRGEGPALLWRHAQPTTRAVRVVPPPSLKSLRLLRASCVGLLAFSGLLATRRAAHGDSTCCVLHSPLSRVPLLLSPFVPIRCAAAALVPLLFVEAVAVPCCASGRCIKGKAPLARDRFPIHLRFRL